MLEENVTSGSSPCPMASGGGTLPLEGLPPRLTWQLGQWRWGDWPSTHPAESPLVLSHARSQLNKKVHTFLLPPPTPGLLWATPTPTPHVTGAERRPHPVT